MVASRRAPGPAAWTRFQGVAYRAHKPRRSWSPPATGESRHSGSGSRRAEVAREFTREVAEPNDGPVVAWSASDRFRGLRVALLPELRYLGQHRACMSGPLPRSSRTQATEAVKRIPFSGCH